MRHRCPSPQPDRPPRRRRGRGDLQPAPSCSTRRSPPHPTSRFGARTGRSGSKRPPTDGFGVYRIPPGGPATLVAEGEVDLTGVGWLGGRSAAAVIDANGEVRPDDPERYRRRVRRLHATGRGSSSPKPPAGSGGSARPRSVPTASSRRVASEGFEWMAAHGPDGAALEDWTLPDEDQPDVPPDRWWPVAGERRRRRRPADAELGRAGHPDQLESWSSRMPRRDVSSAAPTSARSAEWPVHADFDGRFWVGTFADAEDPDDRRVAARPHRRRRHRLPRNPPLVEIACPSGHDRHHRSPRRGGARQHRPRRRQRRRPRQPASATSTSPATAPTRCSAVSRASTLSSPR